MTIILILMALIAVVGIVAAFHDLGRDGYRQMPTRAYGEETLTRYR